MPSDREPPGGRLAVSLAREAAAAPCLLGAAANGAWRHRFRKYCLTAERSGLPMPGTAPSSTVQMIAPPSP